MASNVGIGIHRVIQDVDGESATVTDNRLDVNATIQAGDLNVGNVDIHLNGGVPLLGGAGAEADGVLRVTLASDDPAVALLGTIDVDTGGILLVNATMATTLSTIAGDTTEIAAYFKAPGHTYSVGGIPEGLISMAFRQDVLGDQFSSLSILNDDWSYFQVNSKGGLYVTGSEVENATVQSEPLLIGGRYDSSARTLGSGDAGAVALNASGHILMDVVDGGQLDTIIDTLETTLTAIETDQAAIEALLITIDSDTNTMQGNLVNLGNATYNDDDDWTDGSSVHLLVGGLYQSSMQSVTDGDVAPFQVDANGVLRTSHSITGLASDDNDTVGTSAEKISGADGDVACKRVDIMAHPSNTGYIWVGDSAVSVDGLNGGIRLSPGDFYSMDIDNTGDVYAIATVNGENVCFNYFT